MNSPLQEFKDALAKQLFGKTAGEAREMGLCIKCGERALPKCYSSAGRKEYQISGMCEECFDALFAEGGE